MTAGAPQLLPTSKRKFGRLMNEDGDDGDVSSAVFVIYFYSLY